MTAGGDDWPATSLMATRGVGRDRPSESHELTEARQGRYPYTMRPCSEPVPHIRPGDRVVVQTRDAFEGRITKESDRPSQLLEVPFLRSISTSSGSPGARGSRCPTGRTSAP